MPDVPSGAKVFGHSMLLLSTGGRGALPSASRFCPTIVPLRSTFAVKSYGLFDHPGVDAWIVNCTMQRTNALVTVAPVGRNFAARSNCWPSSPKGPPAWPCRVLVEPISQSDAARDG